MDRYHRVEKPKDETAISDNEIRITSQGKARNYITYGIGLLQDNKVEICLKAMGKAISKTVTVAEIIKRRVSGLHQVTTIGSADFVDTWEPLEEGLVPLETTRHVSMITITLSKNQLDTTLPGYQTPLPAEEVKPQLEHEYEGDGSPQAGRGRGRARGRGRGRTAGENEVQVNDYGYDAGYGRGRQGGRGRGRGRFRGGGSVGRGYQNNPGRGRGYVDYNYNYNSYEEAGEYQEYQPQGRGRGGGYQASRGRGRVPQDVYVQGDYQDGRGRGRGRYRGRRGGVGGARG